MLEHLEKLSETAADATFEALTHDVWPVRARLVLNQGANGFQDVDRAHDIGRIGLDWVVVGTPDDRLAGHVDDHLWRVFVHHGLELV